MARRIAISTTAVRAAAMQVLLAIPPDTAMAERPSSKTYVSYRAPANCPDRAAFIRLLERRISPADLTDDAQSGRPVSVTLQPEGDRILGRLEYRDESGRAVLRVVPASRCEEVVSAMAFVTALAIEEPDNAFLSEAGASAPDANSSEAADLPPPEASPAPPKPKRAAQGSSQADNDQGATTETPVKKGPRRRYVHEAAVSLRLVNGVVGSGLALGAAVEWGTGPRPLIPLLRAAASWTDNRSEVARFQPNDAVHFRLLAAELQLCTGTALIAPAVVTLGLCSGLEAGQYLAEGSTDNTSPTTSRAKRFFWSSVVNNLHLRAEGDRMFFDISPSLRLPLVRREFFSKDRSTEELTPIHSIPQAAVGIAWSVGMSFR